MMPIEEDSHLNTSSYFFDKYIQYAVSIISSYDGKEPFHLFIKKYFSINKKHGSKDRKLISSLCYNYFRLSAGVNSAASLKEKILLCFFLREAKPSPLLGFYNKEWNAAISLPLQEKLSIVKDLFDLKRIFPFIHQLSKKIDTHLFEISFFYQPNVFIRIRPGCENYVIEKLKRTGIEFKRLNDSCLSFSINKGISEILSIDKEAVIQDYNSQKILDSLKVLLANKKDMLTVWDCCAGSGGKSLLAYDTFKNIQLTVSDKRKSILKNLKTRFDTAGIKNYLLSEIDLQFVSPEIPENHFDLIIADVPCSGSGTWQRTPERLLFFKENEIEKYAALQKKIIENAIKHLQHNSYLLYVTCSVFAKENEDNVLFLQKEYRLELLQMEYLKGYETQADTLFTALLIKK